MLNLRGITWDHPRGYHPLAETADIYASEHGVKVSWEKRSLKDFGDAPIDALAERYDVLIIDHPHAGLAAATDCLLPLDLCLDASTLETLAQQSAGPSHQSYHYEGHQWALAIDAAMQTSAYRPDLLDEPLPDTWEAVLDLGRRQRARGRYISIPLVPTDSICSFLSLCASFGDPPGHEDGTLVDQQVGERALEYLDQLRQIAHPNCLDWNPIYMLDHMSQFDDVIYCPLTFCYTNYARAGYKAHIVRFHDVPGAEGALLGGTGFAVSSRCEHPEAACPYGAWLCSAEIQRTLYLEHDGQPANIAAWEDEDANQLTHNFFRDTLETLKQSYVRPRHSGWVNFQEAAGNVIHAFLRDQSSVQHCLNTLMDLYRESLKSEEVS